jgi:DNA-binding FrmR family transcriptional regulator
MTLEAQFQQIAAQRQAFQTAHAPIISMDTKKRVDRQLQESRAHVVSRAGSITQRQRAMRS